MKRSLKMIAKVVVVAVALQLCAYGVSLGQETTTLEFMNWVLAQKATEESLGKNLQVFEAQNPTVKFKYTNVDYSNILAQLIVRTSAGNAPDIAQTDEIWIPYLAIQGALEPLDDYEPAYLDQFIDKTLESLTFEEKLYGLMWSPQDHTMWYDRGLLERAGYDPEYPPLESTQDFKQAARKIHALDENIFGVGFDTRNHTYGLSNLWVYLRYFGGHLLDSEGKVDFNTPEVKELLSFIQEMCGAGSGYKLNNVILREIRAAAGRREVGFMVDGTHIRVFAAAADPTLSDPEKFWKTFGASDQTPVVSVSNHSLVMFKQSKNKEVVWELMKFLTSSETVVKGYMMQAGMIPPLKTSYEKWPELLNDPMIRKFVEEIIPQGQGVRSEILPSYASVARVVMVGIQRVVAGEEVDSVMERVQIQLEAILGG